MNPINENSLFSSSFAFGDTPVEAFREGKSLLSDITGASKIEANSWLPAAAAVYDISQDLRDYILVPVPATYSDIPNTNGDCVTLAEWMRFDPQQGQQCYKTFRGKPCFFEHDNQDPRKAKGVILDCYLRPLRGYGNDSIAKIVMLHAFDRSKDPVLADQIVRRIRTAYSIGFAYSMYTCSHCGRLVSKGRPECEHTSMAPRSKVRRTYRNNQGDLVFRYCHNVTGFESSSVADPAFIIATNDKLLKG